MIPMVGENLEHFGNVRFVLGLIVEFLLHHFANFLRLGAIDRKHEALWRRQSCQHRRQPER